ncbi:MAG: hypothetical protein CM1200mP16_16120 [Nitrospina sp.]|nr:MAG: hypothetical protein CM1200mP16_16120 [Nitrospina sp.]
MKKHRAHLSVGDVEDFMDNNREDFDLIIFSAVLHHLFDYEIALKKHAKGSNQEQKILIFFEPLRQEVTSSLRYAFHRTLSWLDEKSYRLEWVFVTSLYSKMNTIIQITNASLVELTQEMLKKYYGKKTSQYQNQKNIVLADSASAHGLQINFKNTEYV